MEVKTPLSSNIRENIEKFEERFAKCDDIKRREMKLGKEPKISCYVAYIEVTVDNMVMRDSVIGKLLFYLWDKPAEEIYRDIRENGMGISDMKELPTMEEVSAGLLAGDAIFFINGYDKALKISGKGYPNLGVQEVDAEKVIRGSKEAFGDSVKLNTSLIRKRIKDSRVKVEEMNLGVRSHTVVSVVYMSDLIHEDLLKNIKEYLSQFEIDGIFDSGVIEQLVEKKWYSPFPQFQTTERPDRAAMAILEGRIVLFSDNSPKALILPTNYNCYFQTSDDYFIRFEIASFIRLIRHIAALLSMVLPGLYLAVTNFHTQILPTALALSFAKAREGVPFPAVIEIVIMELSFELIREAGVRLPGVIGNTIGIVGGLIIGQAAVEANLVSPIVVVIIALTALCSFSIPNEEFASAFRLNKFLIIFMSAWMGVYGFILGMLLILIHLAHLKSFGIPYLMPFSGLDINEYEDGKDTFVRLPIFMLRKRPPFTKRGERIKFKEK